MDHTTSFHRALTVILTVAALLGGFNMAQAQDAHDAPAPGRAPGTAAIPTNQFLNSIGICSTFPDRGQPVDKTIEMLNYGGFRWVRAGIEGLREGGKTTMDTFREIHEATGVLFNWGLVSGGTDIDKLIRTARVLAEMRALLAIEGNNEPNNWGITYQGEKGGGQADSWMAVAKLHRDLYQAVRNDPVLKDYPVWSLSENGAQKDNVGLQYLTIPEGADTLMPAGTRYADYANCHNYIYHPNAPGLTDNKSWNAADPTPACKVDGLYGNYGKTWLKKFDGYSIEQLKTLPRVTTETGCTINDTVDEETHGKNLLSLYLAQFSRGWSYTSVYILRDRTDESGNQKFGFFNPDYTPRKAAVYLHNLTTLLDDPGVNTQPGRLDYSIANQPDTVHDLLLQRSDRTYQLVVWGEMVEGEADVTVNLGDTYPVVTIYNPIEGTGPIATHEDVGSVDLTMSDHPWVLEIRAR